MVPTLSIEDLVPDLAAFVRTSFDLRPALHPGAMSHRLDLLPTAASLDDLLELDALPAGLVRMTRPGQGLASSSYTRPSGTGSADVVVDRSKIMQLFRSGATLTINDLQRVSPPALELVRLLGTTFACRSEATAFATPAGRSGFAPHADELGVVVVQSEGTKNWRVWPTDLAGPRTRATFTDDELGDPILQVTLEPGDVLYLPQGTPHAAAATHDQSVHLSLGLRPLSWNDVVSAVVGRVLDGSSRSSFPALTESISAELAADLRRHLATLRTRLDALDAKESLSGLRRSLLEELFEAPSGLADLRQLDECSADQLFRTTDDAIEVLQDGDERCVVRVDGVTVTLPAVIVSTLASRQCANRSLTCRQIYPEVPLERAMSIAKQLTRLGALSLVPMGG